jgi:hypothetical protein
MQIMMDELQAIKALTKSISRDMDNDISVRAVKKIANLMSLIDGLKIPDIVCSFEEVNGMEYFDDTQGGMA